MIKLEVDFGLLSKSGLEIDEFCMLLLIVNDQFEENYEYICNPVVCNLILDELEADQWIKQGEKIELRQKSKDLFSLSKENVEDWIEEWRNLFPTGASSSGYRYRGDKQECLKKMKIFVKKHKYTKEQIINATKKFIEGMNDYRYLGMAQYFIQKEGSGSRLLMCLQAEQESTLEDSNPFVTKV